MRAIDVKRSITPKISVCIPIYNCGRFIGEALDSVLSQSDERVEIVVYDGGSTDDTPALMDGYCSRFSNIRYHRAPVKGGIDADMAACVALSVGEFCWLFSGDDVMRPGAISRLAAQLDEGPDVFICEHTICDRDMKVLRAYPVLDPNEFFEGDLSDTAFRHAWFRRAASSEAFFSFMSGLVVRRRIWDAGRLNPLFDGSCWGHVVRLLELARDGLRVRYVAQTWLDQRGGNDSFLHHGLVNRYALAIDGYMRIAEAFFPTDSPESLSIRRVLAYEFTLRMFLLAKLRCHEEPTREDRRVLDRLVRVVHGGHDAHGRVVRIVYRFTPMAALRIARRVWIWTHPKSSLAYER